MSTSYDEIPYMGRVHSQTHLDRIGVIASLFQVKIPDLSTATILELGCGDGSNIINMAYNMPNASFVGIDASRVQIERGIEMAKTAGVKNVQLVAADLTELDASFGTFDFILCHGVFSWVPQSVRNQILKLSKSMLHRDGIAYISYNTLPGWRMYGMLRDMMQYHGSKMESNVDKISQARAMVQFISECVVDPTSPYAVFLKRNVDFISSASSEYLFHEYLEDENQAYYFHEFAQMAAEFGLQYVGDTEFNSMNNIHYPEATRTILDQISPTLHDMEQYMDFLRNRRFRCSLLAHDEREIDRQVCLDPFLTFRYAFRPAPTGTSATPDLTIPPTPEDLEAALETISITREAEGDTRTGADFPLYRVALTELFEQWPAALPFDEVLSVSATKLGRPATDDDQIDLCLLFQALFLREMIELRLLPITVANRLSERPIANPVARHQASLQGIVCSQRHEMVMVSDPWVQVMLTAMDGSKTVEELCQFLLQQEREGALSPLEELDSVDDKAQALREKVDQALLALLVNAVLVG